MWLFGDNWWFLVKTMSVVRISATSENIVEIKDLEYEPDHAQNYSHLLYKDCY